MSMIQPQYRTFTHLPIRWQNCINGGHEDVCLRNKSWKPECVGNFYMDWRILVFYCEPEARDKIY